eukprot:3209111-Pleurochrysis_carterae.AAC.1
MLANAQTRTHQLTHTTVHAQPRTETHGCPHAHDASARGSPNLPFQPNFPISLRLQPSFQNSLPFQPTSPSNLPPFPTSLAFRPTSLSNLPPFPA